MTPEAMKFVIDLATIMTPVMLAVIALAQVVIVHQQRQIHTAVNSTATALVAKNASDLAVATSRGDALLEASQSKGQGQGRTQTQAQEPKGDTKL